MQIEVMVAGAVVKFRRSSFTGRADLFVDGHKLPLQDPLDPATHLRLALTRTWRVNMGDNVLTIEKTRPLLMAGFRPHSYRVLVDGHVVAERRGY
jgi:hypothetical protein